MPKIKLDGFIKAFSGLVAAMEETRNAAAPEYKKAAEEWAGATSRKAVELLDRPNWLLSRSISDVVKRYDKTGKIWAMAGIVKEKGGNREPAYYIRFHESGWRKGGGKPSAPPKFLKRAKLSTTPNLIRRIEEASEGIKKVFEEELKKTRPR